MDNEIQATDLTITEQSIDTTGLVKYTETSFNFLRKPTWEESQVVVNTNVRFIKSCKWWLGALANQLKEIWGEKWVQLFKEIGTDYDIKTIMNAMWVDNAIRPAARYPELSWSHHECVSSLDPVLQDKFLKQAFDEKWTVDDLRKARRGIPAEKKKKVIEVRCPSCGHSFDWEV